MGPVWRKSSASVSRACAREQATRSMGAPWVGVARKVRGRGGRGGASLVGGAAIMNKKAEVNKRGFMNALRLFRQQSWLLEIELLS